MGEEKMVLKWSVKREVEVERTLFVRDTDSLLVTFATVDDLRRACEAAGLVVETREERRSDVEADKLEEMCTQRDVCLARAERAEARIAAAEREAGVSLAALALAYVRACERLGVERDQLGIGLGRVLAERDDIRAKLEKAERLHSEAEAQVECRNALRYRIASLEADLTAAKSEAAEAAENSDRATERLDKVLDEVRGLKVQLAAAEEKAARHERDWYDAKSEFGVASGKLRERIRKLEADLAAARARIAELEAPMPEATVRDLEALADEHFHLRSGWSPTLGDMRVLAIAVAGIVRRERPPCLIARAVAANIDVRVAEDVGGGFLVGIHRPGEDEHVVRNVPADEVPAELARMLTEVGA